jgi:hypothetical protein
MINQKLVLLPMLVVVLLTFIGLLRMFVLRAAAAKVVDPAFYRTYTGGSEPEAAHVAARHWNNLFELPTLFYAACLTAFLLGAVTTFTLVCAWGFVAGRVVQSAVHLTSNIVPLRGAAFVLGALFLFALWGQLALAVLAAT